MSIVLITGCHRSGTSLAASFFYNTGFDISPYSYQHTKYFEDKDLTSLNDRILKSAGGNWKELPTREQIEDVSSMYDEEIMELSWKLAITDKNVFLNWCLKDPRFCLTWPMFVLHLEAKWIVCLRDPSDIATSINELHALPNAPELVADYYQRVMPLAEKESVHFVKYEDYFKDPLTVITEMFEFVGIGLSIEKVKALSELIHQPLKDKV